MSEARPTVLITGGSGFIGSALARQFVERYAVISLDRPGQDRPPKGVDHIDVDLTDDESVRHALARVRSTRGPRLASVVHLAAYYDFSGEHSPRYDTVTVGGSRRLLRALRDLEVEQFVFSSTMLVHAPSEPGRRIDETWPLLPKWPYPESKVRTETLLRAERGTIPLVIMRIAGVYTDECRSPTISQQIRRIYERAPTATVYPGDLAHGQAFVHLDDVVDAIVRAIERRAALSGESVVLIGEPVTLSYAELQVAIGELVHGEDWHTGTIAKAVAKAGAWVQDVTPGVEDPFIKPFMVDLADDHYELDITRARDLLGWEPRRALRETLPRMVTALKDDPERFYKTNHLGTPPAQAADREEAAR
ncbi:MAG: NAD(P)-dependent oxidoreductase [Elusimicrobia bacterium]|nr:NAD(P)-dependent oxidoreductase [Elusimicrobiota bacterium]